MPKHWQPKDRREDVANDIQEWVQRVSSDPQARLPSLQKMNLHDLTVLMLATRYADDKIGTK